MSGDRETRAERQARLQKEQLALRDQILKDHRDRQAAAAEEEERKAALLARHIADALNPNELSTPWGAQGRNLAQVLRELDAEGFLAKHTPQENRNEIRRRFAKAGLALPTEEDALRQAINRARKAPDRKQ